MDVQNKLCIVHPRLESKGGSERWVLKMAQYYKVPVYCLAYNQKETFSQFEQVDVKIINAPLVKVLFFLPKKIRESIGFSVALSLFKVNKTIICCSPPSELAAIRNKLVWYCQSPNRLAFDAFDDKMKKESLPKRLMYKVTVPFFRVLDKFAVSRARRVFANSENIKERLKHYMNVDAEVLYQGVNTEQFYSEPSESFFFYPSRITRSKRFEMTLDAFERINKKYADRFNLVIAGFLDKTVKDDVDYFNEITTRSLSIGRVKILTGLSDKEMKKLYATCLTTVYTPKNEDFGLVPVEAAAASKPCIGINEGGLKETIIDGGTGFLVNNVDELAQKMELMIQTLNLAAEMGKRANLVCKEKFSWNNFFEKYQDYIKVLYFVHTYNEKNGIAIHLKNLLKFLPSHYRPTIVYGVGKGLPFFSSLRIPTAELLEGFTTKCDVIHIHGYGNFFSFFGALLAIIKRVPLVWTIHGYPRISGKRKIFYYVYRYLMAPIILWKATKIISVSDDAADLLKKETKKEISVLPNGVDLELFVSNNPFFNSTYSCYVGRLDKDKVAERMFEAKTPIIFIGPDEDNGRKKLQELKLQTKQEVLFEEVEYSEMPKAYDRCRYVILPSRYEGFPLTLLEAVAMQRPFICTDVGQVRKTFHNLGLGDMFLLKENENIGDKIVEIEQTEDVDEKLAEARLILVEKYSWKVVCRKLSNIYSEVI